MNEPLTFWLGNKNCTGIRVAAADDQVLVLYRDRYHVVTGGAAQTRGGKPLRFSASSLPAAWKRALKGEVPSPATSPAGMDPVTTTRQPKPVRKRAEKPAMPELQPETNPEKSEKAPAPAARSQRKVEAKPVSQPPVVANCPYCTTRHEIPVERGKNGKPFFIPCNKCRKEFAVRFVQVIVYQAQVAGFS